MFSSPTSISASTVLPIPSQPVLSFWTWTTVWMALPSWDGTGPCGCPTTFSMPLKASASARASARSAGVMPSGRS